MEALRFKLQGSINCSNYRKINNTDIFSANIDKNLVHFCKFEIKSVSLIISYQFTKVDNSLRGFEVCRGRNSTLFAKTQRAS